MAGVCEDGMVFTPRVLQKAVNFLTNQETTSSQMGLLETVNSALAGEITVTVLK